MYICIFFLKEIIENVVKYQAINRSSQGDIYSDIFVIKAIGVCTKGTHTLTVAAD